MGDVLFAATPGKWLVALQVRQADGRPASLQRLALRWAVKASPLILLCAAAATRVAHNLLLGPGAWQDSVRVREAASAMVTASQIAFVVLGAGMLATFTGTRRPLHDLVAGTGLYHDAEVFQMPQIPAGGFTVRPVDPNAPPHQDVP
jgi:uncharacterized RDD family membrane protein YckC